MFRHCIFFFVFLSQLIIISSYTLVGRSGHTAHYIDNKIYFLGGESGTNAFTNDFFYLDVSKPFNLDSDSLPIFDLTNNTQIPKHTNAISTICGPNKDTIFLSGFNGYDKTTPFVFEFTKETGWFEIRTSAKNQWSSAVCDENATIYILNYNTTLNETITPDTVSWTFSFLTISYNLPDMTILLQNGNMVYIEKNENERFPLNNTIFGLNSNDFQIFYVYDTNYNNWGRVTAIGPYPSSRTLFTTVLTQDGFIILYGGIDSRGLPVIDPIVILNVNNFTWSNPAISPKPSSAPSKGHTATLVGNYMVIAFGSIYSRSNFDNESFFDQSNQIHIFDVSDKNNFKWVKDFTPYSISETANNVANSTSEAPMAIIGGTIGGITSIIIIVSVSYLLYRRTRNVIYASQAKHAINC